MSIKVLKIPKEELKSLTEWVILPDEQKEILLGELEKLQPTLKLDELKTNLIEKSKVDKVEVEKFFNFAMNLYATFYNFDKEQKEFIDELLLLYEKDKELELKDDKKAQINKFIERLLKMDKTLGIIAKGINLRYDYPNLLLDTRIITDFRPIFSKDVKEIPSNAIVIHNLKLSYGSNTKTDSEFYIVLDSKDLRTLKKVIERAISKEKTLKKMCEEKNINVLGN